ncbi:MAG: peptidylprolyl isomerase [Gammaproteobacteria bacterium]|nr:peptidylprolyl isomerase [Gammaproteobacteria bacterium]
MTVVALTFGGAVRAETLPQVRLQTTLGDIVISLQADKAPLSVANFLDYVKSGFYDGTIFHRVIGNFMIQGGGFTEDLARKKTGRPIRNEADNGLENIRGTIAMARTGDPHSATSQFFINVMDNDGLNHTSPTRKGWGYAVFGRVVEGMDVVDEIRRVPTTTRNYLRDVPVTPVLIERAVVEPLEN